MATLYVALQALAVVLMAINCWLPALIVAGVALGLAFRRPLMRWLERESRRTRMVPPRPAQVRR